MRTLIAFCLLALCLPATADQRLFYQPLNRDASVTPAQWQQLWQATAAQGGKTLIVQWSAYGDSDFGGAQGWLANSLRTARAEGLQLVLGLYMDPAYYQRLDELDGEGLNSYWKAQLGRSLSQYQQLRQAWQLPVDGWYLPMELDDQHLRETERRDALYSQLQAFNRQLDKPLHISAFSTGKLTPRVNAVWLDRSTGRLGLDCVVAGWRRHRAFAGVGASGLRAGVAVPGGCGARGVPPGERAGAGVSGGARRAQGG